MRENHWSLVSTLRKCFTRIWNGCTPPQQHPGLLEPQNITKLYTLTLVLVIDYSLLIPCHLSGGEAIFMILKSWSYEWYQRRNGLLWFNGKHLVQDEEHQLLDPSLVSSCPPLSAIWRYPCNLYNLVMEVIMLFLALEPRLEKGYSVTWDQWPKPLFLRQYSFFSVILFYLNTHT